MKDRDARFAGIERKLTGLTSVFEEREEKEVEGKLQSACVPARFPGGARRPAVVAKSNDRCTRSVISIVVRGLDRYA